MVSISKTGKTRRKQQHQNKNIKYLYKGAVKSETDTFSVFVIKIEWYVREPRSSACDPVFVYSSSFRLYLYRNTVLQAFCKKCDTFKGQMLFLYTGSLTFFISFIRNAIVCFVRFVFAQPSSFDRSDYLWCPLFLYRYPYALCMWVAWMPARFICLLAGDGSHMWRDWGLNLNCSV